MSQLRHHGGHGHHHHHDNPYLRSSNRHDAGVRVTRLGLYVNVCMAVGKGIGGEVFHSQALVADAFHALTDMVSDVMTLATISIALRPPTQNYPLGFGKFESLGALVVSGLLLAGGVGICLGAVGTLLPEVLTGFGLEGMLGHGHEHDHGHGHGIFGGLIGHSHSHQIPDWNAAWLAGGSIVVKEWLYRRTMKIAKERKSSVLASNAVHHRVDSLTAFVALIAIAGTRLIGVTWLDAVGNLVISALVIRAGLKNTLTAASELCDRGLDEDVRQSIVRAAQKADVGKEIEIVKVQGIKAGQNYLVEIDIAAPSSLTLESLNKIETTVRERVGAKVRGVRRVRVRFVPKQQASADDASEFISTDVSPRSSPEPEDHEHRHHEHQHNEHSHTSGTSKQKGNARKR